MVSLYRLYSEINIRNQENSIFKFVTLSPIYRWEGGGGGEEARWGGGG